MIGDEVDRNATEAAALPSDVVVFDDSYTLLQNLLIHLQNPLMSLSLADRAEVINAREVDVAECMRAQGFDYKARVLAADDLKLDSDEVISGDPRYALTFGYGLAQDRLELFEADEQEIHSSEYFDALYGSEDGPGCADLDVQETQPSTDIDAFYDRFGEFMDDLEERVLSDKRTVQAEQSYTACIRSSGGAARSREEMSSMFFDEFSDLVRHLQEVQPTSMSESDRRSYIARLENFREREIKAATAEKGCADALFAVVFEVTQELEQELIDTPEFQAFLLTLSEQRLAERLRT